MAGNKDIIRKIFNISTCYHYPITKVISYEKTESGLVFRCSTRNGKNVKIEFQVCSPYILRFKMSPVDIGSKESLLEVRKDWSKPEFKVSELEKGNKIKLETKVLTTLITTHNWEYLVLSLNNEIILREDVRDVDSHGNYRSPPLGIVVKDGIPLQATETFALHPKEGIYGFGEKFTRLNKVGQRMVCWNCNPFGVGTEESYKNIPFFVSSRGYGIFLNTTYPSIFEIGSRSLMTYTLWVGEPRLDLFIIYGPKLKDVLKRYAEITGFPSLPPLESFGIWYTPYFDDNPPWTATLDKKFSPFYPLPSNVRQKNPQ